MRSKLVHVIGTRPNIPKFKPIWAGLEDIGQQQEWINTGQHYSSDLFEQNGEVFQLAKPFANLGIEPGPPSHFLSSCTRDLSDAFEELNPDLVVVYGDVTSTLSATLAAKILGIKVAHIEAGLRSFDTDMPEEINRMAVDAISDFHFVTLPSAKDNLLREGKRTDQIFYYGNTMIDSLQQFLENSKSLDSKELLSLTQEPYVLLTLHRGSNVDDPQMLSGIMAKIFDLSRMIKIIFPVHPRTRKNLTDLKGVELTEPLKYSDFIFLTRNAKFVITDSGGIQEETSFLGVPCFTLRANTERPETVTLGTNTLISKHQIPNLLNTEMKNNPIDTYGWDGNAGIRIARKLKELTTNCSINGKQGK